MNSDNPIDHAIAANGGLSLEGCPSVVMITRYALHRVLQGLMSVQMSVHAPAVNAALYPAEKPATCVYCAVAIDSKSQAWHDVANERLEQDSKYGGHACDDRKLMREFFGLIDTYRPLAEVTYDADGLPGDRKRLVRVAALAIAAIESYDRRRA